MGIPARLRRAAGAVAIDLPPFLWRTLSASRNPRQPPWAWICNRDERLTAGPEGEGVCCLWDHARQLHLTNVFDHLSSLLLNRMLRDWPIQLRESPKSPLLQEPRVSFIIGHRGTARLEHLLLTIKSIAGQTQLPVECIVVEQDDQERVRQSLPDWVRYHFTRTSGPDILYNRSWALNEGARLARSGVLVLHDGDMLVPSSYAAEAARQIGCGYDVVNLKRFIAYLNRASSEAVFRLHQLSHWMISEHVVANLCAGGSLVISREAYARLGGMDEAFVGWGGEDSEFWDRCQLYPVANHAYLPIIHLWHPSQPGKGQVNGMGQATAHLYHEKMAIPRAQRVAMLGGQLSEPRCGAVETH